MTESVKQEFEISEIENTEEQTDLKNKNKSKKHSKNPLNLLKKSIRKNKKQTTKQETYEQPKISKTSWFTNAFSIIKGVGKLKQLEQIKSGTSAGTLQKNNKNQVGK